MLFSIEDYRYTFKNYIPAVYQQSRETVYRTVSLISWSIRFSPVAHAPFGIVPSPNAEYPLEKSLLVLLQDVLYAFVTTSTIHSKTTLLGSTSLILSFCRTREDGF
jgi:hypothetical protein